jgi:hypothetical protein
VKGNFHAGFGEKYAETRSLQHEKVRCVLTQPVFHTRSVSDWELSLAHLRSLERAGIIPIGIHLGNDKLDKLHKLFPRLVNCPDGEALADKLGEMLCSLA